nr:MAG TPA: tail protein [Caudoviricetes sp.]
MIIYSPTGETLLDVMPDDNSYRHRAIMGDNSLTLYFSLPQHVEIPVGAYCEHDGERYTLMHPESLKMHHTRHFEYTVELVAEQGKMSIWKFRNTVDGRLRFSLTAKPHEHLQMLVDNLNRRDSGWTLGACIDSPERVVNYDHAFCRDALAMIAKEFGTEYEIVGKRISLGAVEHDRANALPLSYGKGNGFVSGVARTNSEDSVPTEILYVQGGERNIDRSKYGASTLHLPLNATIGFDGARFEGETGYDARKARRYRTDEKGFSVQRADRPLSSMAEDSVDLTDIYPSRVGTVAEVITANEQKHFYDFTDPTIPDTLDFEKCLIAGEKMTVIFQSGMLSGREFEVKYAHAASGKKARRFEIVPQEVDGQTMPGGAFVPRLDDKYAVFHCMLPQAYINDTATRSGTEWDLLRKAVKHLYSHEDPKFSFTGTLDGIWAKRNWENVGERLKIGAFILFSDKQFQPEGVAVRIVGIKDYINTPHSPEIELSNAPVSSSFGTTLKALESAAVAVEEKHREALQYSKRRFRDAQETAEMIGAALSDRFTNAISPAAVQTMSLLVGDESLQFRFVGSRTNPTAVPHVVTYNAKTKTMNAASGILQHLTLGIRTVSAKHSPSEYRFWDVAAFTSGRLDDAAKKYYLYVRAPRNGNRAEFVLKESPVGFESDAANYHLLVGVLNSEYDGDRSFAPLYGFSEVLPGRITTDRVATSDGRSFFDLAAGEMRLGDSLVYQNGRLSLRGTLVQNEGGVTSPLACYRGEWNAATTYYNGDEVRNTDAEGVVSTYRYIGERSSSGAPLTDKTKWTISASGVKGKDGDAGESYHQNLLENSAFTKGFDYWNPEGRLGVIDDTELSPVQGTRAVRIDTDMLGALPFASLFQSVTGRLRQNTTYTLSVWVKTSLGLKAATILFAFKPFKFLDISHQHGGEWTRCAITFTTFPEKNDNQSIRLRLNRQEGAASVWFAAPKLEVGDTPTEWTPSENDRKGEKGDNGRGVSRMRAFYMLTTERNAPQPDTSGWTETAPQPTKERPWLWSYERSEYTDGGTDQTVVRLIGHYGKDGTNGTSIRAQYSADAQTWHDDFAEGDVWMRTGNGTTWGGALRVVGESGADGKSPVYDFAASSQLATASSTTAPTIRGTWQDAPPTLREGEVLWYRLTAANGKITYGRLSGEKGKTNYTHIAYANSADGEKDFTMEEDLGRGGEIEFSYFGIYADFDESASQDYHDYVWTRLRGVDGKDGLTPNANLLDGTNFESRVPWVTFNVSESAYSFNGKPTQFGYSQLAEGQFKDLLVQEITSVLKVGQTYTFSAWMQARGTLTWIFSGVEFAEAPKVNGVQTGNASGAGNIPENKKSWEYEKVTVSFKVKTITSPRQYFYIRAWGESSLNVVDPKLEVGAIDTPWCPSVGDLRADYRELRFAVNGSPTQPPAISSDRRTPEGWSTVQPVVGVGQYLWMISAMVSRYETALLDRWSSPTRITPEDGKNGRDGEAPAMVYRGVWDASKEYYGTMHRRDAVFYEGAYYIARTDAGTFRGVAPTDKLKWNDFGASFESVATQLLLAEHANVGRWILSNGNLVSDLDDTRTHIKLDARENEVWLHSAYIEDKPKGAESSSSDIVLKASSGGLATSARFASSGKTYNADTTLSWEGVSSIVEYVPDPRAPRDEIRHAVSGRMTRADNGIAVGVAGYAENYGDGDAFGGYFVNLKALGLVVGLKRVGEQNNNAVSLNLSDTRVVGLHDNFVDVDVRLPAKASEGQTIVFTQVGRGTMKILPPAGESNHRFGNYSERILSECSVNRSKTVRLTLLRNVNIGNERGINLWIVEE